MKLGYSRCFSNLLMDSFVISSNLLALSTTRREKSISDSTFQPLEMKPSFLYINPGVSKYFICMFLIPSSLSLSKHLIPEIISVVVLALEETALIL